MRARRFPRSSVDFTNVVWVLTMYLTLESNLRCHARPLDSSNVKSKIEGKTALPEELKLYYVEDMSEHDIEIFLNTKDHCVKRLDTQTIASDVSNNSQTKDSGYLQLQQTDSHNSTSKITILWRCPTDRKYCCDLTCCGESDSVVTEDPSAGSNSSAPFQLPILCLSLSIPLACCCCLFYFCIKASKRISIDTSWKTTDQQPGTNERPRTELPMMTDQHMLISAITRPPVPYSARSGWRIHPDPLTAAGTGRQCCHHCGMTSLMTNGGGIPAAQLGMVGSNAATGRSHLGADMPPPPPAYDDAMLQRPNRPRSLAAVTTAVPAVDSATVGRRSTLPPGGPVIQSPTATPVETLPVAVSTTAAAESVTPVVSLNSHQAASTAVEEAAGSSRVFQRREERERKDEKQYSYAGNKQIEAPTVGTPPPYYEETAVIVMDESNV